MAPPSRPSLSITLPSNFEFHYSDGQLPKTPDQQRSEPKSAVDAPPPPRPQFKIKRRRAAIPEFDGSQIMSDTIIPTIEMSEATSEISSPMLQPTSTSGLLAPFPSIQRLVTPPKTPAPRVPISFSSPVESPPNEWALISDSSRNLRPAYERAGSVCSTFSDSSISSCGSSDFSAPQAGSCTSPESEATDPFMENDIKIADKMLLSPKGTGSSPPKAKRAKTHRHAKWTQAMDDHLWMTYMQYLSDPQVTPFKMLPGTAPPLGVCSRVVSKARRTWSQHRANTPNSIDAVLSSDRSQREGSPDTIRPDNGKQAKQPQWPRSDGNSRRRLRILCKRKPSLSAHYQRLLHTRSPSPFQSSSTSRSSEPPPAAAFSGRDMNVSLVAATAPSMQPAGPLAQLSSDDSSEQSQRASRPANWFARIPRSQAHQKSLSLQSGLSVDTSVGGGEPVFLASPFDDASSRTHLLQSMTATQSLGRTGFQDKSKGPGLDSPVDFSGASTLPRSLKRRFKSDEEKPRRPALQDVFAFSEDNVTARNRGFSVGAVQATDNLAKLFTVPAEVQAQSQPDTEMTEAPLPSDVGMMGSRSVPRRLAEPVPRLGSPFTETSNRPFNTFPRSYIPSSTNPQPFQQRLKELVAESAGKHSG